MSPADHLLIFGASARAAAFSALRAGRRPWCADLFADADLLGRCPAVRLPGRYPEGFLQVIEDDVAGPWMFTGGLENHPGLVGRLAAQRRLLGNGPDVLACIRSPDVLARAARAAGIPAPRLLGDGARVPGGRWLVKPLAGSGGTGIRFLDDSPSRPTGEVYLQEHVEGVPAAALFVAAGGAARLLGLSRQLVGEAFLHAPGFRYCGSIGPLPVAQGLGDGLARLGDELAWQTRASGLLGVDGILREGAFWPIEVNPRYTASVEVIEQGTGLRALDWHCRACEGVLPAEPVPPPQGLLIAKAILYGRQHGTFPREGPWRPTLDSPPPVEELPDFADVPHAGDRLAPGRPVLTLFARGATVAECLEVLRHRAAETERWLHR
jgi:predicted ATP-grasp superfamily ATP-dependent carboligase